LLDEIIKNIGEGGFGSVFAVKKIYKNINYNNDKREYYAMKQINLKDPRNFNYNNILIEINGCYVCKHGNIVQYVDHYYDERNECVCLILELCEFGSLSEFLKIFQKEYPNKHISEEVYFFYNFIKNIKLIISIMIDICSGLLYFEKHNLLHKDIKLDNILICENLEVKIGLLYFILFYYVTLIQKLKEI
jgi:serine/threonine protein kinase